MRALWRTAAASPSRLLPLRTRCLLAVDAADCLHSFHRLSLSPHRRSFSSAAGASPSPDSSPSSTYERIHRKLTETLHPSFLQLEDTSGGCGSFYRLVIASAAFDGQSLVRQHRAVKEAIKQEIAAIHGLTITTMTDAAYQEKKRLLQQDEVKT